MVEKFCQAWAAFRRRRSFLKVRRQFAKVGYPLDGISDSQVEAALTNGQGEITDVVLSAKIIHHALRRLLNMRRQRTVITAEELARARGRAARRERALSQ